MKDRIVAAADAPRELEAMFRAQPREFRCAFSEAFAERPDSPVLRTWQERLFFGAETGAGGRAEAPRWQAWDIGLTVVLSLVAGTLVKLPDLFPALDAARFYSRSLHAIVLGALILYFLVQRRCRARTALVVLALLSGALLYLHLLPGGNESQVTVLSCLHMPFFLWSVLGAAFLGGRWRNPQGRMDYLRYNGELLIYSTIILIGGMVLTALTLSLFGMIRVHIEEWYLQYVVVYGTVAAPVVATLLVDRVVGGRFRIAPLLARVFAPLFLLTVGAYLVAMIPSLGRPFTERDFLIVFNALLLAVLGICIGCISERDPRAAAGRFGDSVNIGLAALTLAVDVIALAAIVFRLASYGFSPNRLAVLGGNLLVFGHLAGLLYQYVRFAKGTGALKDLERWVAGYIPAYAAWSLFVAVGFPLIFGFR